jgi:hypothetical protein
VHDQPLGTPSSASSRCLMYASFLSLVRAARCLPSRPIPGFYYPSFQASFLSRVWSNISSLLPGRISLSGAFLGGGSDHQQAAYRMSLSQCVRASPTEYTSAEQTFPIVAQRTNHRPLLNHDVFNASHSRSTSCCRLSKF